MLTKGVIGFVRRGPGEFQSEDLRFAALSAHLVAMALTTLEEKEIAISRSMELEAIFRGQFEIVGQSAMIREVFQTIERVAPNDTPVLVTGETGTGKELVANAIHANGPRSSKPYIPVNCAALPNSLLDSSLFGFVKGAFTGADKDTKGCFEKAHEGTLFLDEVAELTINAQAKLLRVLEDGVVQRIGDDSHILVDVRLIFATHRDLEEEVREKRFREDLFYRLNVIKLHLPPLRERTSDIPLLAEHFFRQSLMKSERVIEGFSDEALEFLQDYPWPGNVRELHNAILRAVILGRGNLLEPSDFGLSENQPISSPPWPVESTMKEIERDHIRQVLVSVGWKKIDAARILQIDRKTLASKCKEYGLDKGGAT
jgi:DNA-binding NtrC family response regulator